MQIADAIVAATVAISEVARNTSGNRPSRVDSYGIGVFENYVSTRAVFFVVKVLTVENEGDWVIGT